MRLVDQFLIWRAYGANPVVAGAKAAITGALFGSRNPFSGMFLQIDVDKMGRAPGHTGLFRADGTVEKEVAEKIRARLQPTVDPDGRVHPTWIDEADFGKLVAEAAGRPARKVSKQQWKTTFDVIARLNQGGKRRINLEQFDAFLAGALVDLSLSAPDTRGHRPLDALYEGLFAEVNRVRRGLADGLAQMPFSAIVTELENKRPELAIAVRAEGPRASLPR